MLRSSSQAREGLETWMGKKKNKKDRKEKKGMVNEKSKRDYRELFLPFNFYSYNIGFTINQEGMVTLLLLLYHL